MNSLHPIWWRRLLLVLTTPLVLAITAWDLMWDGIDALIIEARAFCEEFAKLWRDGE